ncbi:MAG TPA: iron ABC transporter permease [Chloroflexota bacterium]|jgi:iron(III) transport system permease protein|nr:iron ABC transporter permease [Chloroflexota bacterium]
MEAARLEHSRVRGWSIPPLRLSPQRLVFLLLLLLIANMVLAPLLMVVMTALNIGPTARAADATLDYFRQAWSSPTTWAVLANTLIFSIGSTLLAMTIGVFFAFMVERTDMPLKNFAYAVVPLTIAMPGLLYGIAWVLLLSPRIGLFNLALLALFGKDSGALTGWAHIGFDGPPIQAYSMGGMIFVDAIRGVGVVFLMTVGIFRNMDPSLEEAAMVAGAPARRIARRITLRLMMPGILAAFVYSLTGSLETFEVPAIMGLPGNIHLLSTKIYLLNKTDDAALASSIGIVFILLAIVFVALYSRLTRRIEKFSTVTGKAYRPRVMKIGGFRYVAASLVWLYLAIVVVAPFFVMVWASIQPYYAVPSPQAFGRVTLEAYQFIFTQPQAATALLNTLALTLVAPTITMLLCTLVSWYVVRSKMRGKRLLDVLAFLPNSIPSIMIALALVYLFLTVPWRLIPIYGTVWIITLAVVTRYLAFGSRTMHSAVLQLHHDLEEAAEVGGVSWPRTMRYIVLPLLFPSIVSGWVFVALHAVRETTMALMLYSPSSRVVSLLMWDTWQSGDVNKATATGVVLMIVTGLIILGGRYVDQRRTRRLTSA